MRISLSALALNLRAVMATGIDGPIDVRADAWGHGAAVVGPMALRSGARSLLVDDDADDDAGVAGMTPEAVFGLSAGFAPVMSLHGRVLSLKLLRAGEGVSYGYTHRAAYDTTVALVTGGYAQGIVRALGNAASVLIAGERHPIVGRVAMDVCVVEVGEARAVRRGDEVVFFGGPSAGSPAIAEWCAATGLTAAELVTAVGLRNLREYIA